MTCRDEQSVHVTCRDKYSVHVISGIIIIIKKETRNIETVFKERGMKVKRQQHQEQLIQQ